MNGKQPDLEEDLATAILMMMAGSMDKLHPFSGVLLKKACFKERMREIIGLVTWLSDRKSSVLPPFTDDEGAAQRVRIAQTVANGIAQRLSAALTKSSMQPTSESWKHMVHAATRDAFVPADDGRPPLNLGKDRHFVKAVFECTELTIAPPGSDWVRNAHEKVDQRMRKYFKKQKLPQSDVAG